MSYGVPVRVFTCGGELLRWFSMGLVLIDVDVQIMDMSLDTAVAAFVMKLRMGRFSYPSVSVAEVSHLISQLSVRARGGGGCVGQGNTHAHAHRHTHTARLG